MRSRPPCVLPDYFVGIFNFGFAVSGTQSAVTKGTSIHSWSVPDTEPAHAKKQSGIGRKARTREQGIRWLLDGYPRGVDTYIFLMRPAQGVRNDKRVKIVAQLVSLAHVSLRSVHCLWKSPSRYWLPSRRKGRDTWNPHRYILSRCGVS